MDSYFNKVLNTTQRTLIEETPKPMSPYSNNKSLAKSRSSNELLTKKNEKESNNNNNNNNNNNTNTYLTSWGYNKSGQLGSSSNVIKTCNPNSIKTLNDSPIIVCAGENHTIIVTQKLKLHVCGANNFGQLGLEDVIFTNKPVILPSLSCQEIIHVSCGADHTFAITAKGEVYAWGSNFKGQLGMGDYDNRNTPQLVQSLIPFGQSIMKNGKKGNNNVMHKRNKSSNALIPSNNKDQQKEKSFSLEFNNDLSLQENDIDKSDDSRILLLQDDERVIDVACGALHTLIKTDKNRIFSAGFGETYALGFGEPKTLSEFKQINFPKIATARIGYTKNEEIDKIACGLTHSGCIKNGKIYLWGLYSIKQSNALTIPTLIEVQQQQPQQQQQDTSFEGNIKKKIDDYYFLDIKLGDALSVFLNSKGEIFTMGENTDGQLGINTVTSIDYPQKVNMPVAISHVATGRNHVLALSLETRQVYGWGSNSLGQLGIKNKGQSVSTPKLIAFLNDVECFRVACGNFHSFSIGYRPIISIENEDMDGLSDEDGPVRNNSTALSSTFTMDIQKYQDDIEKLKLEVDKLKNKNYRLTIENDKLKTELFNASQKTFEIKKKPTIDANIQTIEQKDDLKKGMLGLDIDLKMKNKKTPDLKPQRVLHPQLEIDFKELILEKQISEGGYGIIYRGRWRESVVAIKMLKIDMKEEHVRDFIYECYAMEALRHPNIVMFLGACTKPPNLAIVLEFCTRGSLWSILQNPEIPLSWEDRKRIALDAARGVNYLHSFTTPVLHRDLKSLNLLLDDGFRTKVADFGWTRTMAATMTGKIGTYQWMAPEVISGHNYTEKADVFSFGIILWEIASREPPYRNISGLQVSIEVANNDLRPTIPKKTPEIFTRLIRKCWDRDPSKRPSFKEIIKELEAMKFN